MDETIMGRVTAQSDSFGNYLTNIRVIHFHFNITLMDANKSPNAPLTGDRSDLKASDWGPYISVYIKV